MKASARAVAEFVDGRTVLRQLASQPPIVLRQTDRGLTMVTGAAGPLGGDQTDLTVSVGDGASLTVGSAGAALALPGAHGGTSHALVSLHVGAEASLRWEPQPLVVASGADHVATLDVSLVESARLTLIETLVLGRHQEEPGRLRTRWRIRRGGRTLLAQDLDVGAGAPRGWDGPAVLGGARVLATALAVDPSGFAVDAVRQHTADGVRCDVLPLVDPAAVLVMAVGPDTVRVGRAVADAVARTSAGPTSSRSGAGASAS
ncbi:urease accessory protein UreD [Cryptosporangium aurantiacum]|uniref:Urease accessory protein UreD n=1 Tax=Cryptosporangium aurantiacum TaxID=134849 RepID=A0A1M7QCU5_9ACTN|nr:urease accessory protein UreD [Cryptosporangium aurantiacum]SHN28644.1 urease accessory protein [Cryptosporangium aurantiacum]